MINFFRKHEALAIAILTGLCYAATFHYEKGYASYFGIPTDFISITPLAMIAAAISVTIFFGFCFMLLSYPLTMMINSKNNFVRAMLFVSPVLILTIANDFLLHGIHLKKLLKELALYFSFCIALWFLISVIIKEKINPSSKTEKENSSPIKVKSFIDNGFSILMAILILKMLFDLISGCGFYAARNQSDFDGFSKDKESFVIVKIYNENIFIKKIENKKFSAGISVLKPEDLKNISISRKKLHWVNEQSNYFLD